MKQKLVFLLVITACLWGMTGCDSHSNEIKDIKQTLLWEGNGECGSWTMNFQYDFVEGIELQTAETLTLRKDGDFTEKTVYYYQGDAMAQVVLKGNWNIEYDGKLDAYFFNQDYYDNIDVQNLGMSEEWFKRFDTDIRLFLRGDAYDSVEDDEDDEATIYGTEIIDYNKNLFLVKNLSYDETYRYEPARDEK